MSAGFEAQHIPFKGAAEAVTEIVAGRADFSAQLGATTLPLLREGKLAALAVSAHRRASVMPEVPTLIESGLPADSIYPFYSGLFLPAKTPRPIVEKLHQETVKALQAPAVQGAVRDAGRRADADDARAVRQVLPRRRRGQRRAGEGGEDPDAVAGVAPTDALVSRANEASALARAE